MLLVLAGEEFVGEAFEVVGFWDCGDDGMVGGLLEGDNLAEALAVVEGGGGDCFLESVGVDVVGAAESDEQASLFEDSEGAEVDFFVSAQGVADGGAVSCEGGRVEDDGVEFVLVGVWLGGGLGVFEPVEDVGGLKVAAVFEVVGGGVGVGLSDGVFALVECENGAFGRLGGGVNGEASLVGEAV